MKERKEGNERQESYKVTKQIESPVKIKKNGKERWGRK